LINIARLNVKLPDNAHLLREHSSAKESDHIKNFTGKEGFKKSDRRWARVAALCMACDQKPDHI
jgi:hypothetical protein